MMPKTLDNRMPIPGVLFELTGIASPRCGIDVEVVG